MTLIKSNLIPNSDYYKYGEKAPFRTAEVGHIRILKFSRPSAQLYQAITFGAAQLVGSCPPTRGPI